MAFFQFKAFYGEAPKRIVVEAEDEDAAWNKFWDQEIAPIYICEEVESQEGS